jgi:hypothetical protein
MEQRASEVIAVMRDARRRITHLVCNSDDGTQWNIGVDEAIADQAAQRHWFFVARGGEALLIQIQKQGDEIVFASPLGGSVAIPDGPT